MVPTPASVLKDGATALDDRDWWVCPRGVTPPPSSKVASQWTTVRRSTTTES